KAVTRWKLTLEYDGSAFSGWQRQENAPSVQQSLEEAITAFCGEEVRTHVAGRTDAGVHALAQVAHADITKQTTAETVRDALNYYLRNLAVGILKVEEVSEDFHARFSARARHYLYRILCRHSPPVLEKNRVLHVSAPLDVAAMQKAAALLPGQHDFSTFRAQNCQSNSPIKTLDSARIEAQGSELHFSFSARSFLYHQVRNMVGSLLLVGKGRWSVDDFQRAFAAHDRTQGGPTAAPDGLYFHHVDY
ncbi:MAG TPA: tRNA pseudouridine(38-40) synthase TruA, partial [Alphaproteobacteria bacterium]|nr:tRNA pseudouridine(38-40) synthase TruA [Alphaproteobacteria bacterium]